MVRNLHELDRFRLTDSRAIEIFGSIGDETCGAFVLKSLIDGKPLVAIASSDLDWDHVSVSREKRVPNWYELEYVKRLFFRDDETALQFHVPSSEHINIHPNVLHLWRWHGGDFPTPPTLMV